MAKNVNEKKRARLIDVVSDSSDDDSTDRRRHRAQGNSNKKHRGLDTAAAILRGVEQQQPPLRQYTSARTIFFDSDDESVDVFGDTDPVGMPSPVKVKQEPVMPAAPRKKRPTIARTSQQRKIIGDAPIGRTMFGRARRNLRDAMIDLRSEMEQLERLMDMVDIGDGNHLPGSPPIDHTQHAYVLNCTYEHVQNRATEMRVWARNGIDTFANAGHGW